ncbi:MAG: cupin domain-containing protein [Synechococcus sp.]|nr:cupin domain-containing protein [Synechococcus sp.]
MHRRCMIPIRRTLADYRAYRIRPQDSNRLAVIFDPAIAQHSLTVFLEIFDPFGQTPPNWHQVAVEMFFILRGQGQALCDGKEIQFAAGDSLCIPATGKHQIINTTSERLYLLGFMVPNERFVELIRSGIPTPLDDLDHQVLGQLPLVLGSC